MNAPTSPNTESDMMTDYSDENDDDTGATPDGSGTPVPFNYAGVPLSPTIIAELAPRLMTRAVFKRSELVNAVEDFHVSQGGRPSESDRITQVKKALEILKKKGKLESAGPGYHRWLDVNQPPGMAGEIAFDDPSEEEDFSIDDVIEEGDGQGSVYAYFFPTYKELAESRGNESWPVKIGMTAAGNAKIRIATQQGTAMPERPVLAYVRRTNTPGKLEATIQSILYFRDQQLEDAPGDEWFRSSPEEIRSIANWVHGSPRVG